MKEIESVLKDLREKLEMVKSERELEFQIFGTLLPKLGWDPSNLEECRTDVSIGEGRIDIALFVQGYVCAFIEVKKPEHRFGEKDKEQLIKYAFSSGAKIVLLTNGELWQIFHPHMPGGLEERKVIEKSIDDIEGLAEALYKFVSKEKIRSGEAEIEARQIIEKRIRRSRMEKTLYEITHKVLQNPPDIFIEWIQEEVQDKCGEKPEISKVRETWKSTVSPQITIQKSSKPIHKIVAVQHSPTYHIRSQKVIIDGEEFPFNHLYEVLIIVANWLLDKGTKLPVNVRTGPKRILIGTQDTVAQMTAPKPLKKGNLFIETHYGYYQAKRLCEWLLEYCGYNPKILQIEYRLTPKR